MKKKQWILNTGKYFFESVMDLESYRNIEILDWYKWLVEKWHYDPHDSFREDIPDQIPQNYEGIEILLKEILKRMRQ